MPYSFNRVWFMWKSRPEENLNSSFLEVSSCISCSIPGCPILPKHQKNPITPAQLNIPMNYGKCMCTVAFCIDRPPILSPQCSWALHITMKTAPKHPTPLSLMFFYYTRRIPQFTSPSDNPSSGMRSTINLYLISPQASIPLLLCLVCMLVEGGLLSFFLRSEASSLQGTGETLPSAKLSRWLFSLHQNPTSHQVAEIRNADCALTYRHMQHSFLFVLE